MGTVAGSSRRLAGLEWEFLAESAASSITAWKGRDKLMNDDAHSEEKKIKKHKSEPVWQKTVPAVTGAIRLPAI